SNFSWRCKRVPTSLHLLFLGLMVLEEGNCWTYHISNNNMTFEQAKKWCQTRFTNMVAIQNKKENDYLNATLPYNPSYYWIGIKKIDNEWTWIGTRKRLTAEAENWAEGEPNNRKSDEACVEIYIKRGNGSGNESGKWNDESCTKKKVALCYTASCNQSSCSGHGECVETINNHSCLCETGFYGPECKNVVTCNQLKAPDQGILNCNHPLQNFSYNSSCEVHCAEGYESTGFEPVWCTASGDWSAPMPACKFTNNSVTCEELKAPDQGILNCNHPLQNFSYNSSCEVRCAEGYESTGFEPVWCTASGDWSAPMPACRGKFTSNCGPDLNWCESIELC
uniref:L-selectin n=1 Tax=Pelusios castaneus TaxID=367368 RepID=A0A8C8R7Z3_9SAUR